MEQEDCDVITTLQIDGLAQLFGSEELESRTTPFQEGEDDMTTPVSRMSRAPSQATTTQVLPTPTPAQVIDGPVTCSRAKKLQQEVHTLLCEVHFNINENYILPKCSTLIVLRYIEEENDESDPEERTSASPRIHYKTDQRVKNGPVEVKNGPVQRNLHNLLLTNAMKAHENLLESLSSRLSNASSLISFGRRNQELCLD